MNKVSSRTSLNKLLILKNSSYINFNSNLWKTKNGFFWFFFFNSTFFETILSLKPKHLNSLERIIKFHNNQEKAITATSIHYHSLTGDFDEK